MTFELLTGELLFNPKKDPNDKFGKNDDHLAQIMELLGRFPKNMSIRGEKGRKYVNKEGCLNRIPRLQNWSMKDVMIAKYIDEYLDIASSKSRQNYLRVLWCLCSTATLKNASLHAIF